MASRTARFPHLFSIVAASLCGALLMSGCGSSHSHSSSSSKPKPAGSILTQSATAMRGVTSVSFTLSAEGTVPIPVKSANGKLLKNGDAVATAQVSELGALIQLDVTIIGKTAYVKGLTAGYQKVSRSSILSVYDPTAVLDPNRGVVPLLNTATNATTDGRQNVAGHDCDHVDATLSATALKALIPGVSQNLPSQLWVDHTSHLLIKASVPVPGKNGGKGGTVIITLSDFNTPFTITPPTSG